MLSKSVESQGMDFYATGINKLISCCQNVLNVIIHSLIKKDVFEPSYNDFKIHNLGEGGRRGDRDGEHM